MNKQARLVALVSLFVFFSLQQQAQAQAEDVPRFEIGAQFSSLTIREPSFSNDFRTEPGFGGRVTFNFNAYLAAEAQVDFYPNDSRRGNVFSGGRTTTGLFGVKVGKRFERFGVFGKARPGFVRFGRSLTGFTLDPNSGSPFTAVLPEFRGRTEFATDIGGVLEFYPTRRIVTRFDIGDTIIRYRERTVNFPFLNPGPPPTLTPGTFIQLSDTRHNFQFSAGIGFRF